jgi:hypothetical protein
MISRGNSSTIVKNKYFLFLCVSAALLVTNQAHAAILYGHDNTDLSGGELYQIDTVAKTVTLVGADDAREDSGPDIQMSPDNSTIYMSRALWWNDLFEQSMFLIDATTGWNLNPGTLSLSGIPTDTNIPTALEFVGETLYASFHKGGPEDLDGVLATIDVNTGAITTIGAMTGMNRPTGGLEYVAGTMYAVSSTDNNDSRLFTVNVSTGAATLIGNLTLGGAQQEAATALACADGTMYTLLTDRQDTNLYSIDLSTGALTLEFDLGLQMNSLTSRSGTCPISPPEAILYGHDITDLSGGQLYQIDTAAQALTLVGAGAEREDSGPDIQMSPDNSTIYLSQALWGDETIDESLFLIDPATGLYTGTLSLSGIPTGTDTPTALEFVGETLYASFHKGGPDGYDGILGTIDLNTGAITPIGEMTGMNRPTDGLEYVSGTMYAVSSTDNNGSSLFTVNLSTGAATLVGNLTLGGVQQEAATSFAYADGTMYTLLADSQDTNLYRVDLSNGALTLEFDLGLQMNSLTSQSATLPPTPHAAILYGHDNTDLSGGKLYQIDTAAQTVTLVGAGTEREDSGPDIEMSPDNSTIYMSRSIWWDDTIGQSLFLIDAATGLNTSTLSLSGLPTGTDTLTALEFVGETLYASFHKGGPEDLDGILGTIDLNTGAITTIGEMTGMNRPTGGLEYVAGTLYAVSSTDNNGSSLFTVNLSTGAATLVGNLTLGGVQQEAATAFAYTDGTMYTLLADSQDTNLYSVDLSTGALTLEFDLGVRMNLLTSRSGTLPTIPDPDPDPDPDSDLDSGKAKVCWHHDDLHVEGKLYLPAGVGRDDLASVGSAVITLADVGVTDQDVEFEVDPKNKDKWAYKDKKNLNGNIEEYELYWKGAKFDYRGDDKFHIHTHDIGATETTFCIHTGEISGAFTVTIGETMYAVSSTASKDSRLFTVNLGTGIATLVGNLTLGGVQQEAATALAYADGTMYTLLTNDQDTNLYSVDFSTGALTLEFDLGLQMNSLTSRSGTLPTIPHAAILYGHDNTDFSGGELYQIDTVAQTVTLAGADAARGNSGPDIQMSPDNSTIYMSRSLAWNDAIDQSLFLIDPATGLNTGTLSLSGFPTGTDTPTALEFVGETLYASFHKSGPEDLDGILGTIDLNTGAITTIGEMTGMNRPTGGLEYAAGTRIAYDEDRIITTSIKYEAQKADNSHVHFTLPFQLTSDMTIKVTGALEETIKVADYFDEAYAEFKLVSAFDPGLFPDGWQSSPETLDVTLTLGDGTNMITGEGLIDSWKKKYVKHWEGDFVLGQTSTIPIDPPDDHNPGDIDHCPNDPNKTEPGECGCGVPEGTCGITDTDGDGVEDPVDNCPNNANGNQADADGDGLGDACDPITDTDGDGVEDSVDNCPNSANGNQADADGDGLGDACDPITDTDGDGVEDSVDNCPNNANGNQADADGDGLGDACDPITDSDDDGIKDSADNCPNNANCNQADADGDGLGDACDPFTDSDGDGMPDDWETQNGLDPNRADAGADQDADGISNLDEYLGGTDPAACYCNDEPDAPVLYGPAVSLTPELQTEDFYDPDVGDTHSQTQWQIIRQADDRVVLDIRSSYELTYLSVPKLVLEEDTSYSWRARFYDNHGFASQWSQTAEFTTELQLQSEDTDGNGILDAQEVDTLLDLDGDGTADTDQGDIKCVNVQGADGQIGISIQDSAAVVAIEALESMDPSDPQFEGQGSGKPEDMPFGLIHFKLLVNEVGAEAVVKVHLSEPVPADSKWYKFDPIADTWLDYSEYAVLSSDGKSVTLTIIDGGFGDLDGTANGIIIDPSGIAISSAGDSSDDEILDSGGESLYTGSACFITTAAHRPAGLQSLNFSADGRRGQGAILILLLVSLIICLKQRGWK